MKVLLLSNLFPSSRAPGRGIFNLNRFGALSHHCETRIVVPVSWWKRWRCPRELFGTVHEICDGLSAAYPTYWPVPQFPRTHVRAMYSALRAPLRQMRREFPFDVMLAAFAYPDGAAAAYLARDLDCPLVITALGSDINELADRPSLRLEAQWALGRAQRVIAVSAALRDRIEALGVPSERIVVVRNGVDGSRFAVRDRAQARAELGLAADRPQVCFVGNFTAEKGVDVLIEAMGLLRQQGDSNVALALIGSGGMEDRLRARVRELGLEEQVRFAGRRPHAEIPGWLTASDVFCLPSRREGCPNVVLEALASGRPVVAARVGGVPELLDARNGVMVPPDDPSALAEGIRQALQRKWDPQALRDTVECLSWEDVGRVYHATLRAALEEWNGRFQEAAAPVTD